MKSGSNYEKFDIREISRLKRPTVYYFLKENGISESYIKNLRKNASSILLNGAPATTRAKIKPFDVLEILKNPNPATQTNFCDGKLSILFEDDDFLVVEKPHNLACTPTRSHYGMNLGGQICKYMQEKDSNFVLRILNRLDRETAGIVIVAKNVLAHSSLSQQENLNRISNEIPDEAPNRIPNEILDEDPNEVPNEAPNKSPNEDPKQSTQKIGDAKPSAFSAATKIEKEYHAIAKGNIYENITIDKPILTVNRNGINEIKRVVSPQGKRAITHVEVVKNQNTFCHIKLTLETGRTHQIRVHLSSIGHPLLGDRLYGDYKEGNLDDSFYGDCAEKSPDSNLCLNKENPCDSINANEVLGDRLYGDCAEKSPDCPLTHTMLILKKISFKHFRTGETITLEVPFPPEWSKFV